MTTKSPSPSLTATARPAALPRALLLATLLASAFVALLGAGWALGPQTQGTCPYRDVNRVSVG